MPIKIAINEVLDKESKTAYWLAKQTGLSHTVISKLRHEQNEIIKRFLENLDLICTALDCGVEDILVRDNKKKGKGGAKK